ncbi:MAG: HNH endonuclease [Flavobacteriales bacterium]|nr:HNH endonuclease [Flavobacteriales bacterium]
MELTDYDLKQVLVDFVDYLLPELTPYESAMYLLLLRKTLLENDSRSVRIGKRTLADKIGKGSRGVKTNYAHITKQVDGLEKLGCVLIGDTARDGTLYTIRLPREIPVIAEKIGKPLSEVKDEDYFTDFEKRKIVFDRDDWTCYYCGDKITAENATLDHFHPQHLGGTHAKDNLRTSCLMCNSIKSGKSYDEAAPLILRSMQERRRRKLNQ